MRRSYSDFHTLGRCPKMYEYRVVQKIQRKRQDGNLYQGSKFHLLLQTHYLHGYDKAAELFETWLDECTTNPTLFEDEKADELEMLYDVWRWFNGYVDHWRDDWRVLHVEEEFTMQMAGDNEFTFTPDLVVEDEGGIWIVDHKTTSAMPDLLPFADLQALAYAAGVKELYPNLRGFIFNYVRKKAPTEPRLTQTGEPRVANVKRIDTTYEMLRDFIQAEAPYLMDRPDHRQRLAELRDTNRFFWRDTIYLNEDMEAEILHDLSKKFKLAEDVERSWSFSRTFMKGGVQSCDRCSYRRLCQGELLGWDTDLIREEEFEPRSPKNVYESIDDVD